MLRFCMVTTFYPPHSFGGDAVFVQALSRGLVAQGHEVDVIHCVDSYRALAPAPPPPAGRLAAAAGGSEARSAPAAARATEATPEGLSVHGLHSPFGVLSPLATQQTGWPLLKAAEMRRLLAAKRFDVIHFHNVSLIGGPAVLRYGSALKLYTLHEHWLLCPMHTLFRDNRELCTEKRCFSCSLRYRRPPQLWRYGRLLARSVGHVDSFLAPTEFTRRLHLASGLPMKIAVLESFHHPEPPEALAPVPPRPFFLYAGRLERIKGVDTLIAAFRAYRAADLVVAGDGGEAGALRAQAQGCDNIRFLGNLPRERLAALLPRALAVLVPSLGYEVFPLVVLEAFAAGTPVIARDRGSLAEIVHGSGGGLLFGDAAGLQACLRRMQEQPALRQALGSAGRRAWQSRWTLAAHLRRYLSLIEALSSGASGAAGTSTASGASGDRETGAA
jgi:glycosyltransferase involved in cell wall biosynthesis